MLLGLQLASGLLIITVILFLVSLWQRSRSPVRGPQGLPLFGHMTTVLRKGLPKTFEDWSRDYGPNYELQMNKQRWYVCIYAVDLRSCVHQFICVGLYLDP